LLFFFFFKQKTAYEITYGDWSSDVCSSDLRAWSSRPCRTRDCTCPFQKCSGRNHEKSI